MLMNSLKLGRMAGIDVYLHPTFLLILLWQGMTSPGSLGLFVSAFACVLLHEFGHALMARRFGIGTEDITLYPIGGVARLRRMPRAPGVELLVALAGPAVNVAIAATLFLSMIVGMFAVDGFFMNLLLINIILAVFNLIPAFPMDGGRVLRALLSPWLGRLRATTIAANVGRGLAVLFGGYCLVNGMWLQVALCAFVAIAAAAELARVESEENGRPGNGDRFDDRRSGDWSAPRGFRWAYRGEGVWQLAPISVGEGDRRWR